MNNHHVVEEWVRGPDKVERFFSFEFEFDYPRVLPETLHVDGEEVPASDYPYEVNVMTDLAYESMQTGQSEFDEWRADDNRERAADMNGARKTA